jgi:hypothetical protein
MRWTSETFETYRLHTGLISVEKLATDPHRFSGASPFCALAQRTLAGLDHKDDQRLEVPRVPPVLVSPPQKASPKAETDSRSGYSMIFQ